jgi:hypothetical protein
MVDHFVYDTEGSFLAKMVDDHQRWGMAVSRVRKHLLVAIVVIIIAFVGYAGLLSYQTSVTANDDLFYLSVGLYAVNTHDCYYHNPATCDAEFKSKQVKYNITSLDSNYGVSGVERTTDKGWLDFYLPNSQRYQVEFEVDGLRGAGFLSTKEGAPTCISTIKVE